MQTSLTKAFFTSAVTTKTQRQCIWQKAAAAGAALAGEPWPRHCHWSDWVREGGRGVLLYPPYG